MGAKRSIATYTASSVGAVMLFGFATPPDIATANAAKWVGFISGHIPSWPRQVDAWLMLPALALLLTPFWAWLWRQSRQVALAQQRGGSFHLLSRARHLEAVQASDEELEYWSNADEMRLWQAAYLWAGKIPASDYPKDAPGIVKAFAERMALDIKRGSLQSAGSTTEADPLWIQLMGRLSDQTEYATVTRRALVEYARLRNEKPRFLNLGQ